MSKNRKFLEAADIIVRLATIAAGLVTGYYLGVQNATDPGWLERLHFEDGRLRWEITPYDWAGTVLLLLLLLDIILWSVVWRRPHE